MPMPARVATTLLLALFTAMPAARADVRFEITPFVGYRMGGGFDAEFVHEGLVAVMTSPQGDTFLVRKRHHVVGVNIRQEEAQQAGPADVRSKESNALDRRHLRVSVSAEFLVVSRDACAPDAVQVIHGRVQTHRAGDVGRARLELDPVPRSR